VFIGVILGGYEGYAYPIPQFLKWGTVLAPLLSDTKGHLLSSAQTPLGELSALPKTL